MFAPGVPQVMKEFHSTNADLETIVISIYVLGFAIGPLFIGPLSESVHLQEGCDEPSTDRKPGSTVANTYISSPASCSSYSPWLAQRARA